MLNEIRGTHNPPETYGQALERQGLADLAIWTKEEQHPAVTGLIIDKGKQKPGPGYFHLFGKETSDTSWWLGQVEAAMDNAWEPYLTYSEPRPPSPTPCAADRTDPPERILCKTYRILRGTERARRVKEMHPFKCQLCGGRIELKEGWYAEGHHIRPLGRPHDGPDVMENIICVCPTCHVKLDYGTIPLEKNGIARIFHHVIDERFIDYHNRIIYGEGMQEE